MEKVIRVKLVNNCNYDLNVSCPGYALLVSKNSYLNTDLPIGTEISIKKYSSSDITDKIYLEEKDKDREIIICR